MSWEFCGSFSYLFYRASVNGYSCSYIITLFSSFTFPKLISEWVLCVQQYFPCQVHLYYKYIYVFICAFSGFFYNFILLRPCILKHWKHSNKSMTLCILGKIFQNLWLESCQPTILFHVLMLTDNVNGQRITHIFVYFIYQGLHFIHGQQITQNFI